MLQNIVFVCRLLIILLLVGLFGCVSVNEQGTINNEQGTVNREQFTTIVENNAVGTMSATGLEVEVFPQLGHSDLIFSVAFSPDGKLILSGSGDNTMKLWDIATGREIRSFMGHTDSVLAVAFSPDGKLAVSGCRNNSVKLWNIETGNEIFNFIGHTKSIRAVAFSPNKNQIVSCSQDNFFILWDTITGKEIRRFSGHTGMIGDVNFNKDGNKILSAARDGIKLWDINTGNVIKSYEVMAMHVAYNPDETKIICGFDRTITLLDVVTGEIIYSFEAHNGAITTLVFCPDGTHILSCSYDRTVRIRDALTGQEVRTFFGHDGIVFSAAFRNDGKQIVSCSMDRTIIIWDADPGVKIITPDIHPSVFSSMNISFPSNNIIITFSRQNERVLSAEYNSENKQILSELNRNLSSGEKAFKLWNFEFGFITRDYFGLKDQIRYEVFNIETEEINIPDVNKPFIINLNKNMILSRYNHNTIKLLDMASGREIRSFNGTAPFLFSPDGRKLVYCLLNNRIALRYLDSNVSINLGFNGNPYRIISVSFSPDSEKILAGYDDGNIKLFDIATRSEIRTLFGHTNKINSVSFSPCGTLILSASDDGTTRLWDIATGKEIASFISFSGTDSQLTANTRGIRQVADDTLSSIDGEWIVITPDGYYAASPLGDRYLNVRIGNRVTGMDSFRHIFHNPDVVRARLNGEPDPVTKKTITIQEAASFFPSTITMQSPATSTSGVANLSVNIVDENQPIQNIKILVNGRLVGRDEFAGLTGARGLVPGRASLTVTGNQKSFSFNIPLALDPGNNLVEVIAFNGYSEARHKITLNWLTDIQPALPNLWILAIGVNKYDDEGIDNLNYCANDAQEIVRAFREQEGKRYAKVNALVIADEEGIEPTAENIRVGLSFLNDAGPRDTILLFLAGHGVNGKDGMFEFLPQDTISNADGSYSNVITGDEISIVLDSPGNRLIFIDACHSGSVDNDRMVRQFMDTNAYVFASCKGNELSLELSEYRHGVFTYFILQTLRGRRSEGILSVMDLSGTVSIDVPRRTFRRQNPVGYSLGFYDFIIGE